MPEQTFQYLVPLDKPKPNQPKRTKENTLLLAHPQETLRDKYVIWSDKSFHYHLFDSLEELGTFLDAKTEAGENNYYEVIFGEFPQRLKLDIDNASYDDFDAVMKAVKSVWFESEVDGKPYSERRGCRILAFRTGPKSYHVLIHYIVPTVEDAQKFYEAVRDALPEAQKSKVDGVVYKKIQNFRLWKSQKSKGNGFAKRLITKIDPIWKDTLVKP